MVTKREFFYDDKTKLLKVKAVTEEDFSQEQVKNILSDLEAKKKQAEETIDKFKTLDFTLKRMEKDVRMKEIIESVFALLPTNLPPIPNKDSIEKTVKYWRETLEKINEDIENLKPHLIISNSV